MGWFSSNKNEKTEPTAPNRENRQKCWETRDAYFECLDKAGVVKAGQEGSICRGEKQEYEGSCAKSWIEYFNQRRIIADAQKERLARTNEQFQGAKK
ncbi:cytochrome oxidase c subunit VIb-domain-containing protein [Crepidotus variabilis]|uniref:Cytochrome oxidase c subunit VIb-domain-containing protein n=1 Tax=Crepidotus variabilis TaxID=179855 RepID=A0A9P6EBF8_9AGAR|nr:cytochrome oxidase c subunit VIb-domain-containing protein [Crepidotus variabilis]